MRTPRSREDRAEFYTLNLGFDIRTIDECLKTNARADHKTGFPSITEKRRWESEKNLPLSGAKVIGESKLPSQKLKANTISFELIHSRNGNRGILIEYKVLNCAEARRNILNIYVSSHINCAY